MIKKYKILLNYGLHKITTYSITQHKAHVAKIIHGEDLIQL